MDDENLNAAWDHAKENVVASLALTRMLFLKKSKIGVITMINATISWVMLNKTIGAQLGRKAAKGGESKTLKDLLKKVCGYIFYPLILLYFGYVYYSYFQADNASLAVELELLIPLSWA